MYMTTIRTVACILLFSCALTVQAQDTHKSRITSRDAIAGAVPASLRGGRVLCQSGFAGQYPCRLVDLLSFLSISDLAAGLDAEASITNDIWGWTDPVTGAEYALVGMNSGTSFVDVSNPENPVVVGFLPTHTTSITWRDIKVYADHAFIVSEAVGHGMQVFDLTQLRSVTTPPVLFQETAHYDAYSDAHNIVINEATGFAYVVGAGGGGTTCGGGLHMVDIRNPAIPTFAGCFADTLTGRAGTGYSHDAQCVLYNGPDADYAGREICIGSNETHISIADVTDKQNPVAVSRATYPEASYIHQGWLSDDQRYFFLDDELDEANRQLPATRTIVWDLEDLDDPVVLTFYSAPIGVIDHNQYVRGHLLFQSNYNGGLRILDITDPAAPVEVAFFDTRPGTDAVAFDGSWSNYPFFESGTLVVTSIDEGLFVLSSSLVETSIDTPAAIASVEVTSPYPNPFSQSTSFTVTFARTQHAEVAVYDLVGRRVAVLLDDVVPAQVPVPLTFDGLDLPGGTYIVRTSGAEQTVTRVVTLIR